MIDYEGNIIKTVGKRNPFRVPDGYFDDFASRLLSSLPNEERATEASNGETAKIVAMPRRHGLRTMICAAACLCAVAFGASVYLAKLSPDGDKAKSTAVPTYAQYAETDTYEEDIADYAMMDNSDIYAYLASNE